MESFLQHFVVLGGLIYLLIPFVIIFEGDATVFTAAFLVDQGLISLLPALAVIVFGAFVGDFFWYFLGNKALYKFPRLNNKVSKYTSIFDKYLKSHPWKSIIISKFTYGFHHAVLLRAGQTKMELRKYFPITFTADIVWISIIGSLGYFFGESFTLIKGYVKHAEIALLIVVIAFIVIEKLVSKYIKKDFEHMNDMNTPNV